MLKQLGFASIICAVVSCTGSQPGSVGSGGAAGGAGTPGAGGSSGGGVSGSSGAGGASSGAGGAGTSGSGAGGASGAAGASGSSSGAGGAQDCDGGPCNVPPSGLLDPASTTTWNPGILVDDQLHQPLGADGLPVRTQVCASPMPGANLNTAISGCPEGQVVQLAAGTYTITNVVTINKGVVLRGMGSQGASGGGTTIVRNGGGSVLRIGDAQDQACYASAYSTGYALTEDAVKETSVVHVGSNASRFSAGDLALLDEADASPVDQGDCPYFKRVDGRSLSERVEIASVDTAAGTVTLTSPLHWTFRPASPHLAQIARLTQPVVRWAGIEHVMLQGGTNPGYSGQEAGGIDVSNAAYSWIKDVQTDATIGGMHVSITGTYRVVVRDSYFHHSSNYGFGADCYGIVLRCGAADNLVENNIVRYMNKPILFDVSGGGNVVGYNYADNSWATPASWQEINIDTHCAFPHMELMEGNYAPHVGATITHGNAGYMTWFRNYSSSQFASPAVAGSSGSQSSNVAAMQFDHGDVNMTVIGNVLGSSNANNLGTASVSGTYIASGPPGGRGAIFELGDNSNHNGSYMNDVAFTTLWLHANYDTVNGQIMYSPSISVRTLPPSLYMTNKPAWWPTDRAWPWVGSDLTPMVGTLPAKERSDSL